MIFACHKRIGRLIFLVVTERSEAAYPNTKIPQLIESYNFNANPCLAPQKDIFDSSLKSSNCIKLLFCFKSLVYKYAVLTMAGYLFIPYACVLKTGNKHIIGIHNMPILAFTCMYHKFLPSKTSFKHDGK